MIRIPKSKLFSAIIVTILAMVYSAPNFVKIEESSFMPDKSINLGLDLRGGSHLLLEVDFEKYLEDQIDIFSDALRKEFRSAKFGYKNLKLESDHIKFSLRSMEDFEKAISLIRNVERLTIVTNQDNDVIIKFDPEKIQKLKENVFDQSIEIVRMRIDSTGTKEPIIQRQGDNYILLQVPGEDDPNYLKNILGQTAKLTFHLVDEEAEMKISKNLSSSNIALPFKDSEDGYKLILIKKPILTGDMLVAAQTTYNQNSQPAIDFTLNTIGAKLFAEATKSAKGKRIAIVLDNKILSAPVVNEPILAGKGIISGNFTLSSAEELALMLRAGALPAPLKIIEERTIGPNLGADSIESGKMAGIAGLISVAIFMAWSYGIMGIFANIALVFSLIYILAMLTMFQATLTLPGIAGIVLTIGMAVDANVLIFERIREELRKNASNLFAIKQGFETAFATIFDSNITTLIAALMLYIFGTGAVKGFAVSLSIGIFASMFSAVVVTKLLIDFWINIAKPKSLGLD